jgi:nucleotide-binding universal stress UspA family protein
MFKHVLLPTDGSILSQAAIQKGVQFAKSMQAKITGISVMPEQKYYLYQSDITAQVIEETVTQHKGIGKPPILLEPGRLRSTVSGYARSPTTFF